MTKNTHPPKSLVIIAAIISALYLINPTAGVFEFIPDNIPFIGNLDEAGMTTLLIWAINELRSREASTPRRPRDVTPPYNQ